jgi:hypothetical protein
MGWHCYCAGLGSQYCDVVLVRGAFSLGKPQGVGISEWGGNGEGWKWGDKFTSNLGPGWTDPSCHSKEGSKYVKGTKKGEQRGISKGIAPQVL